MAQTHPNIEYIVIDGGSVDGTVDILRQYDGEISLWISEPDGGPEDSLNKGIALSTGQCLLFCCSDDWLEPDTAEVAVENLKSGEFDFVYGDLAAREIDGTFIVRSKPSGDFAANVMKTFTIASPSFAVSRKFIDLVGGFDETHLNSDYDWFLRAHLSGLRGVYDERLMVNYTRGGNSDVHAVRFAIGRAKTAIHYGANPAARWLLCLGEMFPFLVRKLLMTVLPLSIFERIRPVIRRMRGLS